MLECSNPSLHPKFPVETLIRNQQSEIRNRETVELKVLTPLHHGEASKETAGNSALVDQ